MNKNCLQFLKAEEQQYKRHYILLYSEYIETMGGKEYRAKEMRLRVLAYQRGQVVEAGNVLKTIFNYTDADIEEIERQVERRYLNI